MIQTILWWLLWASLPVILKVSGEEIIAIIEFVKEAQTHTEMSGKEKYKFVLDKALESLSSAFALLPLRIANAVIELAVVYVKGRST